MDHVSARRRSEIMARIRSRDTQPELLVRRALHRAGLRYRLHDRRLPGSPDLVFASRRACVFVHGCFWHGCPHCSSGRRTPKSNVSYWRAKLRRNRVRDAETNARLKSDGWTVLEIWACRAKEPKEIGALASKLKRLRRASNLDRPRQLRP